LQAAFDPRPDPQQPAVKRSPPPPGANDFSPQQRMDLADHGMTYLEKALALRPAYREAMLHMRELCLQKSFALFADPRAWQKQVDRAEEWRKRATTVTATTP
jgi:hypothetical protein